MPRSSPGEGGGAGRRWNWLMPSSRVEWPRTPFRPEFLQAFFASCLSCVYSQYNCNDFSCVKSISPGTSIWNLIYSRTPSIQGTLNRHCLPNSMCLTFSTIWLDMNNLYCLNPAKTFLLLDLHLTLYYQISFSALPLPSLLPFYFHVSLTQRSRSVEQANFTRVEILKWKLEFHKLGF